MAEVYLFTWNLHVKTKNSSKTRLDAHDLALQHLENKGKDMPFIACLQEVPASSSLAGARDGVTQLSDVAVVTPSSLDPKGRKTMPRGMAIAFDPRLTLTMAYADPDEEFLDVVFELPASKKTIRVVGLHAKAVVDMPEDEDRGGSRALLRHAINERRLVVDHFVLLGDWNSELTSREISSWHCFYALNRNTKKLMKPKQGDRRGREHPPYYVVHPGGNDSLGTFAFCDSGEDSRKTIDFIAADEGSYQRIRSAILTSVASASVATPEGEPSVSDHLPVEGILVL
jgi:endonuclease/exonuclease/phosphatase family metal-dependent hydrolase